MASLFALASEFGSTDRHFDSIANLDALIEARKIPMGLAAMGCENFGQITAPPEVAIKACIARTLERSGHAASEIDQLIFATSDNHLHQIGDTFARSIMIDLGLDRATPSLVGLQQCVGSLTAVDRAARLVDTGAAALVLVVAFDIVDDDDQRVQPFALFGDAVTTCLVGADRSGELCWQAHRTGLDPAGLRGEDDFASRKSTADAAIKGALGDAGIAIGDIKASFSTNFFKPIALFNANISGIASAKLAVPTMKLRGHCGNCDWMMNLEAYCDAETLVPGDPFLAQAFAPGFSACAVLRAK